VHSYLDHMSGGLDHLKIDDMYFKETEMDLHTTEHTELYSHEQQETGIRSESHIIGERSGGTRFVIEQIISNRAQLPFFRRNFQHTTKKSKI